MHTRIQAGRVIGYQPTLAEFNKLLAVAQKGIEGRDAVAELYYRRGRDAFTSRKEMSKIEAEDASKLVEDSGNPKYLTNLRFSAEQEDEARRIKIFINPDGWTYYEVESVDFTWALGRFHELTEILLTNRKLLAIAQSPSPGPASSQPSS